MDTKLPPPAFGGWNIMTLNLNNVTKLQSAMGWKETCPESLRLKDKLYNIDNHQYTQNRLRQLAQAILRIYLVFMALASLALYSLYTSYQFPESYLSRI